MNKELLLQNYFSNRLTAEQEQLLEKLLHTDEDFKAQFDFEKNLQQVIRQEEKINLKTKLIAFEKDMVRKQPVRHQPRTNYRKLALAASIALLIGLGWLGYLNFSGPNYGQLYEENFQDYPNTVYAITRGESVESIEREAFTAYELGDYERAVKSFEKISESDKKEYLDFYLGMSHLNLGQLNKAKTFFDKAVASNSEFEPEAYWYLALISIKEEDKQSAKNYLRTLTSKFDYNKGKALELLGELE